MGKTLKNYFISVKNKRLTTVAGAWVYYFITALLPISFLMIIAFGVFGVSLHSSIIKLLPTEFMEFGEVIFSTAEKATGGVTIFFAFAVLFSGSHLLHQMLKDGEYIYNAHNQKRSPIIKRMLSLLALSVLFLIFLGSAFIVAFQSAILRFLNIRKEVISSIVFFSALIVVGFFIVILLNMFVSPVKQKFNSLLIGSFLSLLIICIGTIGFTLYLRFFKPYNALYGSLASLIIFLIWAYIVMLGLVIGVSVNAVSYENLKNKNLD